MSGRMPIPPGGTAVLLQRHGEYVRDDKDERRGSLKPEAAEMERATAEAYYERLLSSLPEEERGDVDILMVASDTQYFGGGRRSLETASAVMDGARAALARYELPETRILNLNPQYRLDGGDGARVMPGLREPQMFEQTPSFVEFLEAEYGSGVEFWEAFEGDFERERRLEMGAEGPDEITDRTAQAVAVLARYAAIYHASNPGRRLVIWADTHYDTISPYVRREVFGLEDYKAQQLKVDYGAGIAIDIEPGGAASTTIAGRQYSLQLG